VGDRWVATAIAVVTGGLLAFSSGTKGVGAMTLWPMFGAVNQLLAALALLLLTVNLRRRGGWKFLVTGLPCLFVLAMTLVAMLYNEATFLRQGNRLLAVVNGAATVLAVWMAVEGLFALGAAPRNAGTPAASEEAPEV
jgi:carbon starvation protein